MLCLAEYLDDEYPKFTVYWLPVGEYTVVAYTEEPVYVTVAIEN